MNMPCYCGFLVSCSHQNQCFCSTVDFFCFQALCALLMIAQKSGEENLSRVFQCEFVDSCETECDDSFEGVSGDSWESLFLAICKHLGWGTLCLWSNHVSLSPPCTPYTHYCRRACLAAEPSSLLPCTASSEREKSLGSIWIWATTIYMYIPLSQGMVVPCTCI